MPLPLRILAKLETFLIAAIMLTMVALYTGAILVREIVPDRARDVAFVDEATRYLMVWMVFLGLGLALGRGRHIAMSAFRERLPEASAALLRKAIDTVGLVFSLYVAWIGFQITQMVAATGQQSPTLGISAAILYASMPIGFALLGLRYGLSLFGSIDRWSTGDEDADMVEGH